MPLPSTLHHLILLLHVLFSCPIVTFPYGPRALPLTFNTSLLASAFPSPNSCFPIHLATVIHCLFWPAPFTTVSSPPPLLPAAMLALYTHYFCLLFHLLLALAPEMTRTFLRSPCQAITYCRLPSCLFLLLHFVSMCGAALFADSPHSQLLHFPSADHACSLTACHHSPNSSSIYFF